MTIPLASLPRSEEALLLAVMRRDPEHAPLYHRRDLDGDGKPETMCNWFVRDVTADLSAPIPNMRANDMIEWLRGTLARLEGWKAGSLESAKVAAGEGKVVVVGWKNPAGATGHVALMINSKGEIAQAGRINFNRGTIAQGFGDLKVEFFIHP